MQACVLVPVRVLCQTCHSSSGSVLLKIYKTSSREWNVSPSAITELRAGVTELCVLECRQAQRTDADTSEGALVPAASKSGASDQREANAYSVFPPHWRRLTELAISALGELGIICNDYRSPVDACIISCLCPLLCHPVQNSNMSTRVWARHVQELPH